MDNLKTLYDERGKRIAALKELATRELGPEDQAKFDEIKGEVEKLSVRINNLVSLNALEEQQQEYQDRSRGRLPVSDFDSHVQKHEYNINKAMRQHFIGRLDGVEREAHEELCKRQDRKNDGLLVPFSAPMQTRNLTTSTGGGAFPTDTQPTLIQSLIAKMVSDRVGVQYIGNIRGIDRFPRQTADAVLGATAEANNGSASSITVGSVSLTPRQVVGSQVVSKMFLNNSSFDGERFLVEEFSRQAAIISDRFVLAGTGSGNQPTGILYDSGITTVGNATNGQAATWTLVNDLVKSVDVSNALEGNLYFVCTPRARAHFATTVKVSGHPQYLLADDGTMCGYEVISSNQLPSNLTKGTGTNLSAVLFGDFSQAVWGSYGDGVEIYMDPFSQGPANVRVLCYFEMDTFRRQPTAFACISDLIAP